MRRWAFLMLLAFSSVAVAQVPKQPTAPRENPSSPTQKSDAEPESKPLVVYKPPPRGAPARRIGGGTRSAGGAATTVAVLVPEDVGLTLEEQPDLFWFLAQPSRVRVEVALIQGMSPAAVKEVSLEGVQSAGVQRFSLREHGVRLAEGTDYEWSVAVVPDEGARSADIYSAGAIRRVAPDAALSEELGGLSGLARARVLAQAGIWYDALGTLSQALETGADPRIREARADLLQQVGLAEAAAFERR
jgi:hypothetical protein